MSKVIRKISIGSDYKNDAMHYSLGQEVYGGHTICDILNNENNGEYSIYIKNFLKFLRKQNIFYHTPSMLLGNYLKPSLVK